MRKMQQFKRKEDRTNFLKKTVKERIVNKDCIKRQVR